MSQITLKGNPVNTVGTVPAAGSTVENFSLVRQDLSEATLDTFAGKRKILNIFPSIDTPVCATSVRTFNEKAGGLDNTVVLCVSADLPFATKRFCGAEGVDGVECLSGFRSNFGKVYGVEMADGPLAGLYSRALVVLDENNNVVYSEQVPEIAQEPNYDAALASLA